MTPLDWQAAGSCVGRDPDEWFTTGAAQHESAAACVGCPVIAECLTYALETGQEYGVWGGQTERQRRVLLKRHPSIDWRAALVERR